MTDKPKSKHKTSRLPRSGLAEDILGKAAASATHNRPDDQMGSPNDPRQAAEGPDRIFDFADSLDEGEQGSGHLQAERLETWVTFELADEVFALPVTHVQEILRVTSITSVPHAPAPVRGVTNKRGRVLPVIDLRVRLGLNPFDVGPASRILVVESRGRLLGLLVDAVHQVVRLAPSAMQPPPVDIMTEQSDFIQGVYHLPDSLVILLIVDRILVIPDAA